MFPEGNIKVLGHFVFISSWSKVTRKIGCLSWLEVLVLSSQKN